MSFSDMKLENVIIIESYQARVKITRGKKAGVASLSLASGQILSETSSLVTIYDDDISFFFPRPRDILWFYVKIKKTTWSIFS